MLFKSKELFRQMLSLFGLLYVGRFPNFRFGINHFRDWKELLETDHPLIFDEGTNKLIRTDAKNITPAMKTLIAGEWKKGGIPEL